MDRYHYTPIPTGASIRILTVFPGGSTDTIRGELELVDVTAGGDYEAVSYVWGDPSRDHQIVCNGRTLSLTASLFKALQRIRQLDRPRRIWVDQVCINQDDLEERSQQVQFMNAIYKKSSHVIVYLGEDCHNEAKEAFQQIQTLHEIFQDSGKTERFRILNTEHLQEQSEAQWAPLKHLVALSWFTRIWVVQEIGTQAPAVLYWGSSECDWDVIWDVARHLSDYHHMRKRFGLRTTDIKYLYRRFIEPDRAGRHANRFSLIYELHRAAHCRMNDPRDRVFAFLGHYAMSEGNAQLAAIRADYTKSVEDVYSDVAKRALLGDANGTLITLAAVQHPWLPTRTLGETRGIEAMPLPSWIPDWREHESHILSEPTSSHNAHAGRPAKLEIDITSKVLSLRGIRVDILEACSDPIQPKEFHLDRLRRQALAIESLWREICGKKAFDLKDRYLDDANGDHAVYAYMQTLSSGGTATASWDPRQYHEIDCEEWLAQGAAYLAAAMPDPEMVSAELRDKAVGGDFHKWTRAANGSASNRSFGRTVQGRYVLGPKVMRSGDVVCVLFGGKMPFVLRPWDDDQYLLVGECYVHGVMQGEAMEPLQVEELAEEMFHLR